MNNQARYFDMMFDVFMNPQNCSLCRDTGILNKGTEIEKNCPVCNGGSYLPEPFDDSKDLEEKNDR
jgi:hypothetical protein